MRRLPIVVSIVVVVLAGSLLSARVIPGTAAQDATPAAQASQQMLGLGQLTSVPGYELQLARVTFPPGSAVPPHTHPGGAVIYVESGTLGWTVLQGETRLLRAGAVATPEAQGEVVAVDTEVILSAGDALFLRRARRRCPQRWRRHPRPLGRQPLPRRRAGDHVHGDTDAVTGDAGTTRGTATGTHPVAVPASVQRHAYLPRKSPARRGDGSAVRIQRLPLFCDCVVIAWATHVGT